MRGGGEKVGGGREGKRESKRGGEQKRGYERGVKKREMEELQETGERAKKKSY